MSAIKLNRSAFFLKVLQRCGTLGLASTIAKHAPAHRTGWLLDNRDREPEVNIPHGTRLWPQQILYQLIWNLDISPDRCWNYLGYCNPYGQTYIHRNIIRCHVLIYDLWHGLPQAYGGKGGRSLVVRHQCDNPRCCNPEHLTIGTQIDNIRDSKTRGRSNIAPLIESHKTRWLQGRAIRDKSTGQFISWS